MTLSPVVIKKARKKSKSRHIKIKPKSVHVCFSLSKNPVKLRSNKTTTLCNRHVQNGSRFTLFYSLNRWLFVNLIFSTTMAAAAVPEKIMTPSPPPLQHMHLSPSTSRRSLDLASDSDAPPDRRSSIDLLSSSTSSPSRSSEAQVTITILKSKLWI